MTGWARPNLSFIASFVILMVFVKPSIDRWFDTSLIGIWIVAGTTFNFEEANIITGCSILSKYAKNSVCPKNGNCVPEFKTSLLIGLVHKAVALFSFTKRTAFLITLIISFAFSGW